MNVNVKDARIKLSLLLSRAEAGDEVSITRRGKEVARLVPPKCVNKSLPSLRSFRSAIRVRGESMSALVSRMRQEERY